MTLRGSRPRLLGKLTIGGVLVLVTALAQAAERSDTTTAPPSRGSVANPAPARFRIYGHATDLYPGARTRLRLTLRNPNPFPITVTKVRTTVLVPEASSCPPRSVKVKRFTGSRRIAPAGVARVRVTVRMRAKAAAGCEGQRYRLAYRGWATRS